MNTFEAQQPTQETKERLVTAAGRLFADLGFTAVSLREIAAEAGVHFSLVNYHFGSKRELYRAALTAAATCPEMAEHMTLVTSIQDPEEQLHTLARGVMKDYQDEDVDDWKVRLVTNELLSNNADWELLAEFWVPGLEIVDRAICKLTGSEFPGPCERLSSISFFMLLDKIGSNARHLKSNNPVWGHPTPEIEDLARHVVEIFLGGVRACTPKA